MTVHSCVIHEVIKNPKSTDVGLDISKDVLKEEDRKSTELLVENIHKSFGSDTALRNTHFEPVGDTVFSSDLRKHIVRPADMPFYKWTINALHSLKKDYISKEIFAVGGYYVFADYTIEERRFISVMVIRKNDAAINFTVQDGNIKPVIEPKVDTDHIAMGFRLNHALYNSGELDRNYISLLAKSQGEEVSGYFKNWVHAAGVISPVKNSQLLVDIIKKIDLPKDENGNDRYTREDFQKTVYSLIESSHGKTVDLPAISKHLYGSEKEEFITNFAATSDIQIDPEFKRAPSILRKLITVRAYTEGIELNVNFDKLNSNEVDVQDDLIIIHSKELAQQIRIQKADQ
jgi:nucleoid-associated protein